MAAGKYDFTLEQGTTFSREITVQDSGSAMNLTGIHLVCRCAQRMTLRLLLLLLQLPYQMLHNGKIQLSATATATAAVEEGIYVYDLEIESSSSGVTRLMEGKVTVTLK